MKKLKLFRTLLVAAMLGVGGSAWATPTVIKTYDFYTASVAANKETGVPYSGTTTINKTNCDNLTGEWEGVCLQGAGSWWLNRGGAHAYDGLYNNNGGGRLFGLLGLKAGDIVTINANGGLASTATNGVYDSAKSTSTSAIFTISADGAFAMSLTRYYQITTVTITRDLADLEVPTYSITGVNGVERQVTLSCLTDGAAIKYNTVNDKSAAGWTTYSAPFYTSEATLYAYSEKSSSTSDVITITTGAGSAITLNAPAISVGFTLNGSVYNPTYTFSSNQTSLLGSPTATITYSFEGGASTAGTSFTPTTSGSITVTVTADGYTSNSTTQDIVGGDYIKTYSFDAINDVTVVTSSGDWENAQNVNGAQWTYTDLSNCTYTLREDITLNTFKYARATTAQTKQGFYTRLGSGSIDYSLNSSELIAFTLLGGDIILAKGNTTSQSFGQYTNVRAIDVYTPANFTVSATIGTTGYTTFSSAYPLNLDGISGGEAYYVSATTSTAATLAEATGTVPAGEGLLLSGTPGATVTIPVAATGTAISGNKLVGCPTSTTLTVNPSYYVLVNNGGTAQFQCLDAKGATIPAGKAYLNAAGAGARLDFVFEDEATGISNVSSQMEDGRGYYDLQGRRVAQPTKGLYIVNGKKMVIK